LRFIDDVDADESKTKEKKKVNKDLFNVEEND
jgi:hypothetical protein